MIFKCVFFVCLTVSLAYKLELSPEELAARWESYSYDITSKEKDARFEISAASTPVTIYSLQARESLEKSLTVGSEEFWVILTQFIDETNSKNVDGSSCFQKGQLDFFALNSTILDPALDKVSALKAEAELLIKNNAIPDSIDTNFASYQKQVAACTTVTCATDLGPKIDKFYESSVQTIETNEGNVKTYVYDTLPAALANVTLDLSKYTEGISDILSDVEVCITSIKPKA